MSKVTKFGEVVSKMMEAVTIGHNSKDITILDETAMAEAEELLNQIIVETARDWWAQLESAEDSLADMSDEISFSELNADPSHVGSPALDVDAGASEPATLESMLESDDFDLNSIFEMNDDDEVVDEGMHYEDGDDEIGPADGDAEFDDLVRGDDENGLGDDGMDGELDMDGDDMDVIGGDDEFGAEDDMGDDLGGDFDFDFLDDEGGDEFGGDEFGGDDEFGAEDDMGEMNHLDHMSESDDDDCDDDDKEEDKE